MQIIATMRNLEVSKDLLEDWKSHPVTKALYADLLEQKAEYLNDFVRSATIECEYSNQKTARYVGVLSTIDSVLFIEAISETTKEEV